MKRILMDVYPENHKKIKKLRDSMEVKPALTFLLNQIIAEHLKLKLERKESK